VYQTTQSLHVATASLQFHSASVDSQLLAIQQTTQSLQVATASLNAFTASQDSRNYVISQFTSSTDAHIVGISAFTSSQLAVNLGNAIYTASVDSHIVGISTYTSSVRDTLARVHQSTQSLQVATASLQQFTASQDSRNLTLSTVTGSLIGITNGLMAFTAALDNTYATDAQLYQLYQATRSIELTTGSLIGITNGLMAFTAALDNTYATDAQLYQLYQSTRSLELHSGSMVGVTNGLMAYTASNTSLNTGLRGEVDGIEAYTASLKGQAIVSSSTQVQNYDVFALNSNLYTSTGSLIGITNGLMAFTAALDSTYATDAQLYQLYQATRSIELTTGSLIGITNGLMAFTAALDNTYATDAQLYQLYAETASIKAEIGGIEAYTASLKAAAIVSSSQQITNYYKFAETASANTFYGNQTINGRLGLEVSNPNTNTKLHIADTSNGFVGIQLSGSGDFTGTDWILYASSDAAPSANDFFGIYNNSSTDSATQEYKLKVYKNGNVNINNGNLIMGTSGKGIDFSATSNGSGTMTSELLNDYEEGTWTATATYSGTNTPTHAYQTGHYTKIGRVVQIQALISWNENGSTGDLTITGLPFTSNNTVGRAVTSMMNFGFSGLTTNLVGEVESNSTLIKIRKADNAGTIVTATDTDNDQDLYISCTYMV
jgi:hypothetical protein